MALPEEVVQQFRTIATERLDRVEAAWAAVVRTSDDDAAILIHREIHTLKGESRMLGFADVNLVCHKLEDLCDVARGRGYVVDDDFDLAVNMAIRFMGMLVRKRVGAHLGGIDLPAFIHQVDVILQDSKPAEARGRMSASTLPIRLIAQHRVPAALRLRLASVALDAFIEHAMARGIRRNRLRASWHELRDLIGTHRAMIGAGPLEKHRTGVLELARDLWKQVNVVFEVDTTEVTAEMFAAIDTATLHLLRNAVDHGIELPVERTAAGKRELGQLRVSGGMRGHQFVLEVEDDGRGVDLEAVAARARDRGLLGAGDAITDRWFDLVCQRGFSTRAQPTDVSGRGVGLDVVRVAIHEAGGVLSAQTTAGRGTIWTIVLPMPELTVDGHVLRIPGAPFPVVVDASWEVVPADRSAMVVDLAARLGIADQAVPWTEQARYFRRNGKTFGIVGEHPPTSVRARRLIEVPPPAIAEVVVVDTIDGLLIHPDRLGAV